VAAAVASLDPDHVARVVSSGGEIGVAVNGHEHTLRADDLLLALQPLEGYQLEREGSHAVALELAIDADLRDEGWAREAVHAIQAARKAAGLAVEDRIALVLGGDEDLVRAVRAWKSYVAKETLATSMSYDDTGEVGASTLVDGKKLRISVHRA